MKPRLLTVACLVFLLFITGCEQVDPYKLHPPAWIWGEWGPSSDPSSGAYTFSETTVLFRVGVASVDLGELYRAGDMSVTETITDTVYAWWIPTETGYDGYRFEKVDANSINITIESNLGAIGPVPLQRL